MTPSQFHEHFQEPSTAPIFQSNDGICFRFEWEPLGVVSSFFRNLRTIPQPTKQIDNDQPEIYELPSATAFAMQFAFTSLRSTLKGMATPEFPKSLGTDELDEILTFANAYDMPLVTRCLYRGVTSTPDILLALAVAAGETKIEVELSLKLLALSPRTITDWARRRLEAAYPEGITALLFYHQYQFARALWECCNSLVQKTKCKIRHHEEGYFNHDVCRYYRSINELFTKIQAKPLLLLALAELECPYGDWNTECFHDNYPAIRQHILEGLPPSAHVVDLKHPKHAGR